MLKTRTSPVILVSCLLTLVLLSSWASGGGYSPTADQLLQECIAGSGGAKRSSFTCSVLLATKESERAFSPNELAALTKVEEEVSNLQTMSCGFCSFLTTDAAELSAAASRSTRLGQSSLTS